MADLIDREALYEKTAEWEATALHMVEKTMNDEDKTEWRKWTAILNERTAFKHDVADAPSVEPDPRWIPVTERFPEVDENVLVSYHFDGDTEFFPPFDGVTISYWTGVKNHNIPHFADMGDACTILAWMPLPEPYREEDDG